MVHYPKLETFSGVFSDVLNCTVLCSPHPTEGEGHIVFAVVPIGISYIFLSV